MPRLALPLGIAASLAILVGLCFGGVLFGGEQFAYRDAAHYYYPLHQRIQQQWIAGHLPLWDPSENGGVALWGDPTAAVLYPGKLIFAALSYPWAARLYLVGHVILAFLAMIALLRGLGISRAGALLGGMAYGFGGPFLFQYSNAIYLVGAAWLPLGFLAVESWLARGRRKALIGLAVVLTLQCLGGDIQSAYLLGLFAALYAVWLTPRRVIPDEVSWRFRVFASLVAWCVAVVILAACLPALRRWAIPDGVLLWLGRIARIAALIALVAVLTRGRWRGLIRPGFGLIAAGLVGFAVAGVQILPVLEAASGTGRMAGGGSIGIDKFSVEPYRLVEFIWPGFFGHEFPENGLWLLAIPPVGSHALWTASLYMGGFSFVLALAALISRDRSPWQTPIMMMGGIALLISLGRYGGPLWWSRFLPGVSTLAGPHVPGGSALFDGNTGVVRDVFGSVYWLVAVLAPGYGGFRFPPKALPFAALALAALTGAGWDRVVQGPALRLALKIAAGLTAMSLVGIIIVAALHTPFRNWATAAAAYPLSYGPLQADRAYGELFVSQWRGMVIGLGILGVLYGVTLNRRWAAPLAVLFMAADLGSASARIVWTVPQIEFERPPAAAVLIDRAEAETLSHSAFRIHRAADWLPFGGPGIFQPMTLRQALTWERGTLLPGFGTTLGYSYATVPTGLEPRGMTALFRDLELPIEPQAARLYGIPPDALIRHLPRRAFDLWGVRYFVLPYAPGDWYAEGRNISAFLAQSDRVHPRLGDRDEAAQRAWTANHDWQLLRNRNAYPKAWIVHKIKLRTTLPDDAADSESRAWLRSLLYEPDPFWQIPDREPEDPHEIAWIEHDDPKSLRIDLPRTSVAGSGSVAVDESNPARVTLDATLAASGLIVLADAFDPGWSATVDGKPSEILRANRMMRAVAVPAGRHQVVFTYEPRTLRAGAVVSLVGLLALFFLPMIRPPARQGD